MVLKIGFRFYGYEVVKSPYADNQLYKLYNLITSKLKTEFLEIAY